MVGTIAANATVTVVDSFATGYVTGRYDAPGSPEQVRAQPVDADVVMTERSASGVLFQDFHEQLVQDGRFSRAGALGRGAQEMADFVDPLVSIEFETDDLNARPGRLQAYALPHPDNPLLVPLTGEYMILSAALTWPVWGQPPRRQCQAAAVHPAKVVDTWVSDSR